MTRYLYEKWRYFREYQITSPPAVGGYLAVITVPWQPGMRLDFRDIRFLEPATNKRCIYWIESKTNGSTATVWIQLNINQKRLWLLFGNQIAASESISSAFTGGTATNCYPPAYNDTYVKVTTYIAGGYEGYRATNPANSLIGTQVGTSWVSSTLAVQRFHIDVGSSGAIIRRIYYENEHFTGGYTNSGSKTFTLWGSNSSAAFADLVYTHDTDWTQLGASVSVFDEHVAANQADPKYFAVTSSVNYRYYAIKIADGWGNTNYVALRRIVLQSVIIPVYSRAGINIWYVGRRIKDLTVTPSGGTEYAFDPVNVDHTHTPGVDAFLYEQSFPSVNVNHSRTLASTQECEMGAVNVYHARYPVFSWDRVITNPVDDVSGNLIGVTVSRGMDDAMTQADFDYDGTTIGSIFSNDYMTKIQVLIPDYNSISRCVFVGLAPSSRTHYEPAKDKMVLTAVDYGLYLTKNPLDDKDLALLPPANQLAEESNYAKYLWYDYIVHQFQLGQKIVGGTSGATGTIVEIYAGASWRMTLYPATGKFIDDEPLLYGGIQYAQADGRSVDIPYTAPAGVTIYPEDWVKSVLGGDNWMRVTGIEPYKIVSSGGYWDTATCPAVPFMFGSKESKFDAMQRLAKYMRYIMLIKHRDLGGGIYRPAFYWVKLSEIDDPTNGLDLPAAATITGPNDTFLAAPFELEQNGDNQVDVVKLMCQDLYGNWLTSSKGTNYANAGEGPIRMFYDEPQDIATQTDLDAFRDDLYDLLTPRGMVWHCTLVERSDLELYQLLTISGYGAKIPNGTYRIVKISHERACAKNLTHITFMLSTAFSTLVKYGMTYTDSISEIQKIIKHYNDQKPQTELGTCTFTNGTTITYETEAGNVGRGRDGTAVGTTPGTIIVSAKIIIHSTRGGVVCLPVVGEAATGTGLSTVDVPTIIGALRDESNHNYWFLNWVPGANNTGVSINVQTGSYPTAPGSVDGPGTTFARYTNVVNQIRIRFSGPSTTYYVKIWGERNGAYSATGAQTTIVSGADVTPGEEDPEPFTIGVFDYLLAGGIMSSDYSGTGGGTITIYSGYLAYNGTDNIYIGGPKDDDDAIYNFCPDWGHQPAPGYLLTDRYLRITGPNGYLVIGDWGWHAPTNIKNLLNSGLNAFLIELVDNYPGKWWGCSDIWIRSYYGAD